jgi:hypothetical protein
MVEVDSGTGPGCEALNLNKARRHSYIVAALRRGNNTLLFFYTVTLRLHVHVAMGRVVVPIPIIAFPSCKLPATITQEVPKAEASVHMQSI